jgi:hypothetical protein
MEAVEVQLPGGLPQGEHWLRSAWLRPISGREEEFLLNEGKGLNPAARVTQLIARCLQRVGSAEPAGAELVRQMSVGDREALLLHLRRLTWGDRIACLLKCPHCGGKMDLDLTVGELLLPAYPRECATHTVEIGEKGSSHRVIFRVPNGADQEAVAGMAAESIGAAAELVVRRCVDRETLPELPPVVVRELPARMAALDPQAEILLNLTCPECALEFTAPFDSADFLSRELAIDEREFYRQIHTLCRHYHWTEDAALALSRRKRELYLEFISDDLARTGGIA